MIFLPLNLYSAVQIYEFHVFSSMKSSFTGIFLLIHIMTSSLLGLIALLVRALHRYSQQSWVRIPFKHEYFSGFIFTTTYVVYLTAMIVLLLNLYFAVQIYEFHIFSFM